MKLPLKTLWLPLLASLAFATSANETAIRKNLSERLPNLPPIEEVSKTPFPGLWEIRINRSEILYSDSEGNFLIQGSMFDTRSRVDLTEQRVQKLGAVDFSSLPLKDAFKVVHGKGTRQIAVFSDPNCGYCKRLEKALAEVEDVTIHVFIYPILGADSVKKSQSIWCAKDKGKTYTDWMLRGTAIPNASCDTAAVERNVALGRELRINGTPTIFFVDGTRVPGAVDADRLEALLKSAKAK